MNSGSFEKRVSGGAQVIWWPCLMVWAMVILIGCTESDRALSPEDESTMTEAITTFLSKNNMGMQVKGIEKIAIQDDEAEVICKLTDADGLYAMGVTWKFWMQKSSGKWVALRYSDKF